MNQLTSINQLTNIFKLLSDESRLRMMVLLYQQDLCVCEICGVLNMPQSRVSKNLSKLRDLNLVTDERREKFVFYSLKKEHVLLIQALQPIIEHLDIYPQLKMDSERLVHKDTYSSLCNITFETQ